MGRGKRPASIPSGQASSPALEALPEELRADVIATVPGFDREFVVRVIHHGERYGRDRVLVNEGGPLVCFFDGKNRFKDGDVDERHYGQATGGQYSLETLLKHDPDIGIDLHGGVDEWKVPAESMPDLLSFLRSQRSTPVRGRLSPLAERRG